MSKTLTILCYLTAGVGLLIIVPYTIHIIEESLKRHINMTNTSLVSDEILGRFILAVPGSMIAVGLIPLLDGFHWWYLCIPVTTALLKYPILVVTVYITKTDRGQLRLLGSDSSDVRAAAIQKLCESQNWQACEARIVDALADSYRNVRQAAVCALTVHEWRPTTLSEKAMLAVAQGDYDTAQTFGSAAEKPLFKVLGDTDECDASRCAAAQIIGDIGSQDSLRPLANALYEIAPRSHTLSAAAEEALVRLASTQPVIKKLAEKLGSTCLSSLREGRREILHLLEQFGEAREDIKFSESMTQIAKNSSLGLDTNTNEKLERHLMYRQLETTIASSTTINEVLWRLPDLIGKQIVLGRAARVLQRLGHEDPSSTLDIVGFDLTKQDFQELAENERYWYDLLQDFETARLFKIDQRESNGTESSPDILPNKASGGDVQ